MASFEALLEEGVKFLREHPEEIFEKCGPMLKDRLRFEIGSYFRDDYNLSHSLSNRCVEVLERNKPHVLLVFAILLCAVRQGRERVEGVLEALSVSNLEDKEIVFSVVSKVATGVED